MLLGPSPFGPWGLASSTSVYYQPKFGPCSSQTGGTNLKCCPMSRLIITLEGNQTLTVYPKGSDIKYRNDLGL
jgi:hypothetical protein